MSTAFLLVAGHPALDLVNTLDWRFRKDGAEELLNSYGDLLRFTEQSQLLASAESRRLQRSAGERTGAQTVEHCRQLREALAEIFYTKLDGGEPPAAARKTLETYFQAARRGQKLNWDHSPRLEWEWPKTEDDPALPVWALALSAADLMTSDAADRVRACGNSECRWLFLDTSKNHTRRWCDMKLCGNRIKARRFKAQRKA
jgi:predicted RNA-binding Zn ribbon-like protein